MPTARPDSYVIASGADLYAGIAAPSPPPPPPPPPPPSPGITLTALGGLSTTVGSSLGFSAALANPASLPLVGTPEAVSGPALTPSPGTVTWSLGDLNKAFSATWAAAGTAVLRVRGADGTLSNSLSVTVAPAPSPTPPPPPPAPGTTLANLTLVGTDGAAKPFTAGLAFRQGDVPSANQVVLAGASVSAQFVVKNRWSDGSVKFGLASGRATISGGTATLAFSAGTQTLGASLDLTALQATGITASVDAGTFGAATWTNGDFASPFLAWVAGPEMSSWIYRKAVGSDAHLVAWLEVRLYAGGHVEVLPWVENGFIMVASPGARSETYTFTLGGSSRFSAAINLLHHQRTVLISGTALSHWLGTDPGVTPLQDPAYLMASELVPSYYSASSTIPNDRYAASGFTPLQQGDYKFSANPSGYGGSDSMADAGYSRPIGLLPEWDMLPLACNTANAYEVCIRNGYSAGRYGIHYRDENTNRPLKFSDYPTLNIRASQGFKDTGGSTASLYTPVVSGANPPTWDVAHSPSVGFMPYLLTGRWYFMEQALFAATANYLGNGDSPLLRDGAKGLTQTANGAWQTRTHAWDWRAHVQALTVIPDSDTTLRTEFITRAHYNIDDFWGQYINRAANPFGFISPGENAYDGTTGRISIWQQDFVTAVWGYAKCLGLPIDSTRSARLTDFFAWKARSVVDRLSTTAGTGFPFENANRYALQLPATTVNLDWGDSGSWNSANWPTTWAEIYARTAPLAVTPDNPIVTAGGNTLATEYDATSASRGIWADMQPALAYAVRHGITGASAARASMVGASNWASMLTSQWAANWPVWGVKPLLDPTALPTWRQGATLFAATPVPNSTTGEPVAQLRAWGCLVPIAGTNKLVSPFNGGHTDSGDNGVYELDIGLNSPTGWVTKIAASASIATNVAYNSDGKTHSRHGYQHAHYIPQRQRVMTFGARGWYQDGGGTGNGQVDGVDVSTSTYTQDPAGTWPSIGGTSDSRGFGIACDPLTGNVWSGAGYLWTQATNTWSLPGTYTGGLRWGFQWDSLRQRFTGFQWDDGQGYGDATFKAKVMDRSTGVAQNITFASDTETVACLAEIAANTPGNNVFGGKTMPNYESSCYDEALDVFWLYYGDTANSTRANQMYKITPPAGAGLTGWTMSRQVLTGMPLTHGAGINGKWRYMPLLKGIYAHPNDTSGGFFIATSN